MRGQINKFSNFEKDNSIKDIEILCSDFQRNGIINGEVDIEKDGSVYVYGNVQLNGEKIPRLPLNFKCVTGFFRCDGCDLESLEGCPSTIKGNFTCSRNNLTSLRYSPRYVSGSYNCSWNRISNLDFLPKKIGGNIIFLHNNIKDFTTTPSPLLLGSCVGNPIHEIYKLNPNPIFVEFLIEYDVIRDGGKIVRKRLERALEDSGGEVEVIDLYTYTHYEFI